MTSGLNAKGRFGKQDFVYVAEDDVYLCPADERLRDQIMSELQIQRRQNSSRVTPMSQTTS